MKFNNYLKIKNYKIKNLIILAITVLSCFGLFGIARATTYELSGTLISKNILAGQYVNSIDYFGYNVDIPADTTIKVQFSRTRSSWYSSAGVQDAWDNLSDGDHLGTGDAISLSTLGWTDPYFYYKISLETTDSSATPVLDEVRIHFDEGSAPSTTYEASGTLISKNILEGESAEDLINSFYYNISSISAGGSARVQFSQNGSNWYNSSGVENGWDICSQGENSIDLNGLSWSADNFYYKMEFSSDGSGIAVLDEIKIYYGGSPVPNSVKVKGGLKVKGGWNVRF